MTSDWRRIYTAAQEAIFTGEERITLEAIDRLWIGRSDASHV
ncbi:hypothetical protein ACWEO4_44515 [Streptomyces sp. NPDC004393]